jgi:hypothetical protein
VGYFVARVGVFEVGPEFEWIHLKVYLKTEDSSEIRGFLGGEAVNTVLPVHQLIERFSISHGSNLLLGNLAIRSDFLPGPPWSDRDTQLIGRVGYGANLAHFEGSMAGDSYTEHWGYGGDAFQVGAGLALPLWGFLFGMVEYKFTLTDPGGTISNNAEIKADLNTHHLVFGLTLQFD